MQNNINFDENIFCNNSCSEKLYFLDWQWIILIIIDIMIIFINSIVDHFGKTSYIYFIQIFLIAKLNLYSHYMQLSWFQISISINAPLKYLLFLSIMFLHTFASEIAALGFDRLLWIRYLKRYTEIVTKKRVVITCITIGAHSTFQAAFLF